MSEERSERSYSGGGEGGGDRRFFAKPKFCQFCADKLLVIDYKKTDLLRKYITEEGKIPPAPPDWRMCKTPARGCNCHQTGPPRGISTFQRQISGRQPLVIVDGNNTGHGVANSIHAPKSY